MKRILITILSVLYMVSATGATVHLHYCMGKLMGAAFCHNEDELCGKCGMKKAKSKGCCKDIHKSIKASDHQLAKTNPIPLSQQLDASLPAPFTCSVPDRLAATYIEDVARAHAPPSLWRTNPIYLQVQNFRI